MEDMCQLTERLTEDKYRGSYEQIAKAILKGSKMPSFDVVNFYQQVVFSYLTGNADMHLKNFSLITRAGHAYDMLCNAIVNPADDEELALTLRYRSKAVILSTIKVYYRVTHVYKYCGMLWCVGTNPVRIFVVVVPYKYT